MKDRVCSSFVSVTGAFEYLKIFYKGDINISVLLLLLCDIWFWPKVKSTLIFQAWLTLEASEADHS